jgi:hypothetical protein
VKGHLRPVLGVWYGVGLLPRVTMSLLLSFLCLLVIGPLPFLTSSITVGDESLQTLKP